MADLPVEAPTRKPRSEKRRRTEMVGLRVDHDERERIARVARQDGVSVAAVVRRAVLQYLDGEGAA